MMKKDIEIAQAAKLKPIKEIAKKAGFLNSEVELHGEDKAKIKLTAYKRLKNKKDGKLILVTTITPTPMGEGKTTVTIGLGQALAKLGKKAFVCIREPSLGPVMGLKGGAAGGGYSQVLPMEDINLHFIGDMHIITSAHNLLAAMLDNSIYQGNLLRINPQAISFNRVMDMNDRALRNIALYYGNTSRKDSFDITAASEVMAIMCLSETLVDMKKRLGNIIVGFSYEGKPIRAVDLKANGAMALLMKNSLKPNLVQTIEGVPAFVHGGPFANIAHGCNALMATKIALKASDYVVTEAGFAADLGAEKFFNIKCRIGKLKPNLAVLVVTAKALKHQGGAELDKLTRPNQAALEKGFANLEKHVETLQGFGVPVLAAINKTSTDKPEELKLILKKCKELGIEAEIADIWEKGGRGGKTLAKKAVKLAARKNSFKYSYEDSDSLTYKIEKIVRSVYGGAGIVVEPAAQADIVMIKDLKMDKLPICIAKTQYSLSDNPKRLGRPRDFRISVRKLKVQAGAGFIVVYTGDILTMPGLPKHPAAENMDVSEDGKIKGLF